MRTIKFRAWDSKQKVMAEVGSVEFCHGGIRVEGPGYHIDDGWVINGGVILMQFTGLYDKNGKEIYEGDILCGGESREKVEFYDGQFNRTGNNYSVVLDKIMAHMALKVIGNVYENPELLNQIVRKE